MNDLDEQHRAAWAFRNELRRGDTAPARTGPSKSICRSFCGCEEEQTWLNGKLLDKKPTAFCATHESTRCWDCSEPLDAEDRCPPCDLEREIDAAEAMNEAGRE